MSSTGEAPGQWDGGRPLGARGADVSSFVGGSDLRGPVTELAVLCLLVPVLVVGILGATLMSRPLSGSLPAPRAGIESGVSRVYDASGAEIASFNRFETTLAVSRQDIPVVLRQAVVASEDKRFYSHRGVDSRGVLRAMWANILGSRYRQGASTITEQYVRLAYTGDQRTLRRKVREAALAGRVEAKLSKNEILYRYLSRAYLGGGAYGVGAAAQSYFRKPVQDLTLSEAALLAGLLPAPSEYDPRVNPTEAEAQRLGVLQKMADQGRITPQQSAEASVQRVVLDKGGVPPVGAATVVYPAKAQTSQYPWFADYVRRYLVARYGDTAVYQQGLRVETSLDPDLQAKAEAAVAGALAGTQAPVDMAMAVLDPTTGLVRAMVGGRDFARSQVNLALGGACPVTSEKPSADELPCIGGGGSGRQPGSAFKPFTLAKALERGFSADRTYPGPDTYTFPNCSGVGCTVRNAESENFGSLTLRKATAHSVNTVFAQLIADVGVKDTAELAHRLGLTTINPQGLATGGEPYGPSLTLGAAEVSPLDMAAAYSVFAAGGLQLPASPVVKVTDADGKVLEDNSARTGKRVLAPDVADGVTDVLKDVVSYGTGAAAKIGRPDGTAGKTGTSQDYGDAWFVGYTPSLVTSVWMGHSDSRRPLVNVNGVARVFGGTIPAQAWRSFMAAALGATPPQSFRPPPAPSIAAPSVAAPPRAAPTSTSLVPDVPLDTSIGVPSSPANAGPEVGPTMNVAPPPPPPPPDPAATGPCLLCSLGSQR